MGPSPTRWNPRRLLRFALFPILIVGVAGFLQWRSYRSAHTDAPIAALEAMVMDATRGTWGDTDQLLRSRLASVLPATGTSMVLRVDVADESVRAATGATHLVTVLESGVPRVILRCRYDPDPLRRAIVGFELVE